MRSNYKQLGQYIRQVDVWNVDGKEENLLGVSVQKQFIPSIANTVGTDFSKYKVVKKGSLHTSHILHAVEIKLELRFWKTMKKAW